MAKYNSWNEIYASKDGILDAKMELTEICDGSMVFLIVHEGKRFRVSGSHYQVGDYNWSPGDTLRHCSDFDSLYLYEQGENYEVIDEVCNW